MHRSSEPARAASTKVLPSGLPKEVREAIERTGVTRLYAFQREAIDLLRDGQHVVLAGGTGSGKSLCYQLPLLEALLAPRDGRKRTALYLAPTKALAQDQARRMRELGASWATPMLYDGDTSPKQRAIVRKHANLLLTNPDMLSAGILPGHGEWATFLKGLSVIVVDESHVYRGVFGSHVAQVLRRLRRLLAHYDNEQAAWCLSSATIGNPIEHASRLTGLADIQLVGDGGAPRAARDIVLWNPELDEASGARDSALGDAVRLYANFVAQGSATIVFARSRKQCELIHAFASERLAAGERADLVEQIAPYRAGYTPEERRATERALAAGELRGVTATSALELGIDIGSLEASIVVTFPGTVTSLRQRWGRAARHPGMRGLCVLIAGDDALDQYFMRNPSELLARPVEHAIVNIRNPRIYVPHLAAAAAELPLAGAVDEQLWGVETLAVASEKLLSSGQGRTTPAGLIYTGGPGAAARLSLRSTGRGDVVIIDAASGQLLGTVDIGRAATSVHPGAVYLHRGESYIVERLDTAHLEAVVRKRKLPYYTMPKVDTSIEVVGTGRIKRRMLAGTDIELCFGPVVVTDQLIAFQRMDVQTNRQLDLVQERLPPLAFETEAVWFAAPQAAIDLGVERVLGALHAAEHGLIAMLPLLATCDRWDIGGLSIDWHEAFAGPGIFVYDGHPGGVGIVEAGFARFEQWARAAHAAIIGCTCDAGCPSCIHSPKCGNLNEPLDKTGAATTLGALLGDRD